MASIDRDDTLLGLGIQQWDVVAAYIQAELKHEIYLIGKNEEGDIEY